MNTAKYFELCSLQSKFCWTQLCIIWDQKKVASNMENSKPLPSVASVISRQTRDGILPNVKFECGVIGHQENITLPYKWSWKPGFHRHSNAWRHHISYIVHHKQSLSRKIRDRSTVFMWTRFELTPRCMILVVPSNHTLKKHTRPSED